MANPPFHLSQLNIARLRAPLDAPEIKEFVDFLDPVNRFAEESPGFVWRLSGDDGLAASYLPSSFDDPMVISNLTVWTDIESLRHFVYQTVHRYFLQNRRSWFERLDEPQVVMWWKRAGVMPTLEEGKQKLLLLRANGPTKVAFTNQAAYDFEGNPLPRASRSDTVTEQN